MNKALQEETLATLGAIAAICAFGFGFTVLGYVFAVKSILDFACAVKVAWQEFKEMEKRNKGLYD